jgi:DNA modification methylase
MKRIKSLWIVELISYIWDMFIVLKARAKSEEVWEKNEAPPASVEP